MNLFAGSPQQTTSNALTLNGVDRSSSSSSSSSRVLSVGVVGLQYNYYFY